MGKYWAEMEECEICEMRDLASYPQHTKICRNTWATALAVMKEIHLSITTYGD